MASRALYVMNYSSLRRLYRVTVYCLKFISGRICLKLSQAVKEVIERRHKLLCLVLSSLSNGHSVCANDLQGATLLWVSVFPTAYVC